jgi:hypothetical protein
MSSMHIAMSVFVIFAVWRWSDWRNWEKYHATMLYIAASNLMYNFLCASYFLWRINADFLSNHTITEVLYTLIIFPGTALLFLSNYPKTLKKQILRIAYYVGIYAGFEVIYVWFSKIEYQYGWTIWWSFGFDMLMFPMLILHYKKPLIAYVISIPTAMFLLWLFNVPVNLPVERR